MQAYGGNTAVISAIGTNPTERGLTTDQFKAKFDEALVSFVTWFNDTHKTEFETNATAVTALQDPNVKFLSVRGVRNNG